MSPSREWVTPDWPGKLACVAGVALSTGLWFVGLSWVVSLGHGKWTDRTLLRIEHLSGVVLLILALIHGGTIVWHRHKPKGEPPRASSSSSNGSLFQRT
jgi:hypothetical protein